MTKPITLCLNADFKRAYYKGKSFVSSSLITYVRKNRLNVTRIGITTSKKIGNAVQRNRARRIIRAAYRQLSENVAQGYDIVFVARSRTTQLKSTDILNTLEKQLIQAGVLS